MSKYTPNSSVAPLGKPSIDFSILDEKLGEGVANGIWLIIRDAVAQEMHGVTTTLSEVLKAVSSSSKTESQYLELQNTTPLGAPPSNISKHRDSDVGNSNPSAELSDAPMVRKRNSRCKGRKRGRTNEVKRELHYEDKLPPGRRWLYYSAYDPNMDGDDMPHCLDLAFRPSKGMKFFGPELAFAAYIFGIWVSQWMILSPYFGTNHKWVVNDSLITQE